MSKIAHELRHAVGTVSTKSFLNPLLWLCGLISIPCFVLSAVSSHPLQVAFFGVGLLPLILISFLVLKYRNRPDLFQSEEYRLRDRALKIYGDSELANGDELSRIIGTQPNHRLIDMETIQSEIGQ